MDKTQEERAPSYVVRCNHNRRHKWVVTQPIKIHRYTSADGRVVTPLVCPVCGLYDAHWIYFREDENEELL